jgi:hypothetical protein
MNGGKEEALERQCATFEARLADALDGTLEDKARPAFEAHRNDCRRCASLYAETELGRRCLHALRGDEIPAPPDLLSNILRATSRAAPPPVKARLLWWQRLRELPLWAPAWQPRLALSLAMAFASLAAILSFTGFDLRDLRHVDFQPGALLHDFYETQGRVVKYCENIGLVYEIESQLRDWQRETVPAERKPQPAPHNLQRPPNSGAYRDRNRNPEDAKDTEERVECAANHHGPAGTAVPWPGIAPAFHAPVQEDRYL